jgi:hypothetical protein
MGMSWTGRGRRRDRSGRLLPWDRQCRGEEGQEAEPKDSDHHSLQETL